MDRAVKLWARGGLGVMITFQLRISPSGLGSWFEYYLAPSR